MSKFIKNLAINKLKYALFFNYIILLAESIALVLSLKRHGSSAFLYYTEISNYFALITSLIFCIFGLISFASKKIPFNFLSILRLISTVSLSVTFFVSVVIIIPFAPKLTKFMLLEGSSFFHHLLCPIISAISFIFFEPITKRKTAIIYSLSLTFLYGIVIVSLNIAKIIKGPYPFLYVYVMPWYITASFIGAIIIIAVLSALFFFYVHAIKIPIPSKITKKAVS